MSGSDANLPFVLGVIEFTYNEQNYTLYSMTNTSGVVNFYIPDDVDSTISLNNAEGTLDNDSFHCTALTRDVTAGTSNNTNTLTIHTYDAEDEDQENYVKTISITAPYDMEILHYEDDEGSEQTLTAGETYELRPGSYTVTIDGSTGHYFDGTLYLYPGTTEFYGLDGVQTVVDVKVTNAESDMVSISTEDGSYHRYDGGYYMEVGYEYYLTSTNTAEDGHSNIAYGYLDLTDVTEGSYTIDMTASQHQMQVTGNVGVVADGTITVSYEYRGMTVKHDFDVTNGAYTITLPSDVSSVDIDSEDHYYSATGEFTGLALNEDEDGKVTSDVRNISVLSTDAPVDEEAEEPDFTSRIGGAIFTANTTDAFITVTGTYDASRVAPGSDGMSVTVQDINGSDSQTLDVTVGGDTSGAYDVEIFKATDEDSRAANDRVSAYQYMYAVTIVNNNVYTHEVVIDVPNVPAGWVATIVSADGTVIAEPGQAFDAYGLQTTVLYVKLMLLEPGSDTTVPDITANVTVGGHSQSLSLSAENVQVTTDDMTVSGSNVFNERSGIPGGIWFLIAVIILMLVATFWFASKRGVFSRR